MSTVKLKDIFEDNEHTLGITFITGRTGLMREIDHVQVQRCTGEENSWHKLLPASVFVAGPSYLSRLACSTSQAQRTFFHHLISSGICCIVLSETASVPGFMRSFSESHHIPLIASSYDEFLLESRLKGFMREKIENIITMHGALVKVFGYGVALTGESGIGKTECACTLAGIGHAWVADDALEVEKRDSLLYGRSNTLVKHLIDRKSIGLIDANQYFAPASILNETLIDLMIEFQKMNYGEEKEHNRPAKQTRHIMGVEIPFFNLSVFSEHTHMHICVEDVVQMLIEERGDS